MARRATTDPVIAEFERVMNWQCREMVLWRGRPESPEREAALRELSGRVSQLDRELDEHVIKLKKTPARRGHMKRAKYIWAAFGSAIGILFWIVVVMALSGCTVLEHNRVMPGLTFAWTKAAQAEREARREEKAWEKSRTNRTNQTSRTAAPAGFDLFAMMTGPDSQGPNPERESVRPGERESETGIPMVPAMMTMAATVPSPSYKTNTFQLPPIADQWAWNVELSTNLKTWVVVLSNQPTGPMWTLPSPGSATAFWRVRR